VRLSLDNKRLLTYLSVYSALYITVTGTWSICTLTSARSWSWVHSVSYSQRSMETVVRGVVPATATSSHLYRRRCYQPRQHPISTAHRPFIPH